MIKPSHNQRKAFIDLFKKGVLSAESSDQALELAHVRPNHSQWKTFLSNLLLWLGVLALASSVMFFIAYNWGDLGRFAKIGLLESLIALSIFVYWIASKTASSYLVSQAMLLLASLFLGVLLAFYGQTYQTGADTWQLFFTWAVLILPWVFIACFPALWILWLVLINLSIILYFQTFRGVLNTLFSSEVEVMWIMAGVNTLALIIWEIFKIQWKWLSESWATRILALASGIPLTLLTIDFIFGLKHSFLAPLLWFAMLMLVYIVYRKRKIDLFMLAVASLSGITVIISAVSHTLFKMLRADGVSLLLLAILVVVLGGFAAKWLKNIHKESLHQKNVEGIENE